MKKSLFLFVILSGMSLISWTQGTLQFNQVKLVTTVQTVPAGKVWKVMSALGDKLVSNCNTGDLHNITVNGSAVTVTKSTSLTFNQYCYGWQGVATVAEMPFWLPEGATLAAGANVSSISVMEFNIIP